MGCKPKVTDKVFYAVKILVDNGASITEAAKYMKLSDWTISIIKRADTYEEYKQIRAAMAMKKKEEYQSQKKPQTDEQEETTPEEKVQVVEHKQTVTIQATHYMMEEMRKTNELLTTISAKLAFIVDELCGTTKGA